MAVEVEWLSDKKMNTIIEDREFDLLYPSVLFLKEKTGIYIDRYGHKTRVYPAHLRILVQHVMTSNNSGALKETLTFFEHAIQHNEVLCFIGD